jgi:hypothetical protein
MLSGCETLGFKKPANYIPGYESYQFVRTDDESEGIRVMDYGKITARFDGLTMAEGMTLLTDQTGVSIIWGQSLDRVVLYGSYFGESLPIVLESVARRCGASVTEFNGIYFIGDSTKNDVVTTVIRMIPTEKKELLDALQKGVTEQGKVAVVGSSLYISDNLENVRKLMRDIEKMREHAEHTYIAEVFFIRVKEDDFLKVTGDLKIRSIDVFSSTANLDELFQMFLDASAGKGFTSVEQRPVLYLSEGRKATFEVGSEIVREKRAVSDQGTSTTTGYEKFQDGLKLSLCLSRVSAENYAIDFELEVSTFDTGKNGADTVPPCDKSLLTLPGLLVKDSKVYYIGSLKRKDSRRMFSLFGVDQGKSNDQLTVWFRVRELQK